MTLEEKQELIKSATTEEELEARMQEIEEANKEEAEKETEEVVEEVKEETQEESGEITPEEERSLLKDTETLETRSVEITKKIERKGETKMEEKELRNSKEYINAYAEYVKTGEDKQLRSLFTENIEDGTIAVPDMVYDVVKTAWDNEGIMSLVHKAELKGNLKVNFEISGTDAVIHTEGGTAVSEETLTEGIVTIVPAFIKKWISISDEVMSLRGEAFLRYIYAELTYKITKKAADQLVSLIAALPQVATSTSPAAAKISVAPAADTIAQGIANLSDEADNPVIIMNKLTYANFKSVQYANNYGVDVFEGLKVLFNNTLPAYNSADEGDVYAIVGDLDNGALANFPNGINNVEFTFDALSRKKEDLVEVLGKEYVGLGIVNNKSFTLIAKPTTSSQEV